MNMININNGLLITLVGMGLVFVAILFLWGLMEIIVKLGNQRRVQAVAAEAAGEPAAGETAPAIPAGDPSLKQRAAAAAVAVAFAMRRASGAVLTRPASEGFSSWQATFRSLRQSQQGNLYRSKR